MYNRSTRRFRDQAEPSNGQNRRDWDKPRDAENVQNEVVEDPSGSGKPYGSTDEIVWQGPAGTAGTSYHVEFKNGQVILWKLTRPDKTLDPGRTSTGSDVGSMRNLSTPTGDRSMRGLVSGINDRNRQFFNQRKDRR